MNKDRVGSATEDLHDQFSSLYSQTFTPINDGIVQMASGNATVFKPKSPLADTMILRSISKLSPLSMEDDILRLRRRVESFTLIGRYHSIEHLFEPYVKSIDILDKPSNYQVSKDELDSNAFVAVSLD
ncbi:hypothetical protein ACOME3_005834 [Neoechinorhynchus agilis]